MTALLRHAFIVATSHHDNGERGLRGLAFKPRLWPAMGVERGMFIWVMPDIGADAIVIRIVFKVDGMRVG